MNINYTPKKYIIADPHFYDNNIKLYENRKISDEQMIIFWNEIVNPQDIIYILGDFANGDLYTIKTLLAKLNGYKILIKGNHDNLTYKEYIDAGFNEVYFYPIIIDNFWILSHEPLYININMPYANIFGHVHNNPIYKDVSNRSFCACVERIDFKPILLNKAKEMILNANKENNNEQY